MDENKTALVKKIGEGNKSLSVIVAEDKLTKFKRFSQGINLSMGYLLNQAIDRYLANNSTEIFSTPTGIPTNTPIGFNAQVSTAKDGLDIEELINTTIKTYLLNNSIGFVTKDDVLDIVNTSVNTAIGETLAKLDPWNAKSLESAIEQLSIPNFVAVKTMIREAIAKLDAPGTDDALAELEALMHREIAAVREELNARFNRTVVPTTEIGEIKTWGAFFEMVGIKPMKAADAQKAENIDVRTKQITQGLKAAKEQGFGTWVVKVAGRNFERITEEN
jgi:hypothetical protein